MIPTQIAAFCIGYSEEQYALNSLEEELIPMADSKFSCVGNGNALRETFGIEAGRILDACPISSHLPLRSYVIAAGGSHCLSSFAVHVPIQEESSHYAFQRKKHLQCER